jgi:predicted  nucleic acid-binding Zn-ribbon protein
VSKNALEVEVQGEQEKIRTYSKQQLETKDNEQYKALGRQQETCKETISNLETDEINVLEEMDVHAEVLKAAKTELEEATAAKAKALSEIDDREVGLGKKIEDLDGQRTEAEGKLDELTLSRYNRLVGRKGTNIVVGIQHGACGGCHMKLPEAEVIEIKSGSKVNYCPNCSRIVYYTRDMVLETD